MGKSDHETANLDLIIDKIRSDGIDAAEKEGLRIKKEALAEAEKIVSEAKKMAERLISEAEKEIKKKEKNSRNAIEFAARDSILAIRSYLEKIFHNIIKTKCAQTMTGDFLETAIIELLSKTPESEKKGIQISLSEENHKSLSKAFYSAIDEKMREGIEIRPIQDISAGFRISRDCDRFYNDFTDETIAEILGIFLAPELRMILDSEPDKKAE